MRTTLPKALGSPCLPCLFRDPYTFAVFEALGAAETTRLLEDYIDRFENTAAVVLKTTDQCTQALVET